MRTARAGSLAALIVLSCVAAQEQRPFIVRVSGQRAPNGAHLSHAQQPPPERRGITITSPRMGEIVSHTGSAKLVFDLIGFSVPQEGYLMLKAAGQVLGDKISFPVVAPKKAYSMEVMGLHPGVQHIDFEVYDHNGEKLDDLSDSVMVVVPPGPFEAMPDFKFPVPLVDWRKREPDTNKFLVFRVDKGGQNGGFGDRMVGLTHTAALAAIIGRGFLIDWTHPMPLDQMLVPPNDNVEWRFSVAMDEYGYRQSYEDSHEEIDWVQVMNTDIEAMPTMDFHADHPSKFVVIRANFCFMFYANQNPRYAPIMSKLERFFGPVFRELFKPVESIQRRIDAFKPKINAKFTIGIHARTRVHECQEPYFNYEAKCGPWDYVYDKTMTKERYLNKYWAAIDHTVAHMRLANESVQFYAMADSKVFFDEVRARYGNTLLTVEGEPFHIDYDTQRQASFIANQSVHEGFAKVLIDLYVLGECDEIIVPLSSNLGRVGAMLKNKLPICTYPFGDFMRMSPHFCECKHDQKHWGPEGRLWVESQLWSKRVPTFSRLRKH